MLTLRCRNTPPLSQPYYPLTCEPITCASLIKKNDEPSSAANECGSNVAGECGNSTRWVGWPNTGPMVVYNYDNAVSAYAWRVRPCIVSENGTDDISILRL